MRKLLLRWLLRNMTDDERSLITGLLLTQHGGAPLRDILYVDERGSLVVDGKTIDIDKMRQLREAARTALNNPALTLIRTQVMHQASVLAMSKAETPKDLTFARAALWWGDEEEKKLRVLAQQEELAL